MSIARVEQSIFSCLSVPDFVAARQEDIKPEDKKQLWASILKRLDPFKKHQEAADVESTAKEILFSKTWKKRVVDLTKLDSGLRCEGVVKQLQALSPHMDQMLCACCVEYTTLCYIPRFLPLDQKEWPKNFMQVFFSHYHAKKELKRLLLILYYLKNGKDCSEFFRISERLFEKDSYKNVFQNPIFDLFFYGLAIGLTIEAFVKAGLNFNYLNASGDRFPFLYYYLLKKTDFEDIASSKPDRKDPLAMKLPFVIFLQGNYLKQLSVLCEQCNCYDVIYCEKTALDIAMDKDLKEEIEILKFCKASQYTDLHVTPWDGYKITEEQEDWITAIVEPLDDRKEQDHSS